MAWFVGAIVASAKADASPGGYFPTYMGKRLEAIRGLAALTDEEMAVLATLKDPTRPTGFGRIRRISGSLNQEALQVLLAIYQDANGIPKALSEYDLKKLHMAGLGSVLVTLKFLVKGATTVGLACPGNRSGLQVACVNNLALRAYWRSWGEQVDIQTLVLDRRTWSSWWRGLHTCWNIRSFSAKGICHMVKIWLRDIGWCSMWEPGYTLLMCSRSIICFAR